MIEEIREEIWYKTDDIKLISSWVLSPWWSNEVWYLYYVKVSWEKWKQALEESEDIEVIEVKKSELKTFLKQKEKEGIIISYMIWMMSFIMTEL